MNIDDLRAALSTRREYGWNVPGMDPVSAEDGHVVIRVPVGDEVLNSFRMLHGGVAATLVDVVGTLAIMTADRHHRPGVSTDLNVSWFVSIPEGDAVIVDASVLKTGKTMAFVSVDLRRESDGVLSAQGRMTKALGNPPA